MLAYLLFSSGKAITLSLSQIFYFVYYSLGELAGYFIESLGVLSLTNLIDFLFGVGVDFVYGVG